MTQTKLTHMYTRCKHAQGAPNETFPSPRSVKSSLEIGRKVRSSHKWCRAETQTCARSEHY